VAITFNEVIMHAQAGTNTGMQVAAVYPLDSGNIKLVINAHNGSVTMELDAADAAGLAQKLTS
jgi:hypothetical protein